jgi:lysophospholipase L1-like esterase
LDRSNIVVGAHAGKRIAIRATKKDTLNRRVAHQCPNISMLTSAIEKLTKGTLLKIVCFGDSITGTYYHTGGRRAWTNALGQTLKELYPQARLEMINAGISGNTSAHGLERMDADVLSHNPDLIIAMFGMNDVAHLQTDDLRQNLTEIVKRAHEHNSEIVLMTPNRR